MPERLFLFGDNESLTGILTEPRDSAAGNGTSCVLFVNAGLTHHVGPHGVHVELARDIETMGVPSLRFDLAGKGDSARASNLSKRQAVRDIQAAMDILEKRRGYKNFILFGICSGADDSYATAVEDSRVSGVVLIDSLGYTDFSFKLHHYVLNRTSLEYWAKWWKKKQAKRLAKREKLSAAIANGKASVNEPEASGGDIYERDFPTQTEAIRQVQLLVDRGVRLCMVYTGGVSDYYNSPKQFLRNFAAVQFKNQLTLEYFGSADHTFSFLTVRREMRERIAEWLKAHGSKSIG